MTTADLLTVTETATNADSRTYRIYSFAVPADAAVLHLEFAVDPSRVGPYGQAVKVVLFDPAGLRGTPAYDALPARLAANGASLGFLAGPLTPGIWRAEVSLEYVLDGALCSYALRIWIEQDDRSQPASPRPAASLPLAVPGTGPGWYAGDLHMHTHQSDGRWSVPELLGAVRRRGLDFFMLTDHNVQWALAELAALDTGTILPIPGVEVSTPAGHMLALGVETWVDWRIGKEQRTIHDVVREIHAAGGLAVIAHPEEGGSPDCHGCRWEMRDVDPAQVDAVEIWNYTWSYEGETKNERGLQFWQGWQAQGYRLPCTGGSDMHGFTPDFPADVPTTYVYADSLTRANILDGLRRGRIVISSGPAFRFTALAGRTTAGPGDTLAPGVPVTFTATIADPAEPVRVRIAGNGGLLAEATLTASGACDYHADSLAPGWYYAEARSAGSGEMITIANPIYVGGDVT